MTDLSREARAVIDAGKNAFLPTNADRLRLTQLLVARVGAASLGVAANAQVASSMMPGHFLVSLGKIIGTIGLVSVAGGALYFANHGAAPRSPATVVTQPAAVPEVPSAEVPNPIEASEPAKVESAVSNQPIRAEQALRPVKSQGDSLGEEVAILTRAEKELHNGRPAAALKALDEHQRRFASGALAQERSAARIQALCALGRTSEAAAESARLTRISPNSPQAPHAMRPCETR